MDFKGKTAVITGAASGIGKEVATMLAKEGAKVVIFDINAENAMATAEELSVLGCFAICAVADLRDSQQVRREFEKIIKSLGRIDILINNAGGSARVINKKTQFVDSEEETWEWVIDLNLMAVLRTCKLCLPSMIANNYGKIVNVSSISGVCGIQGMVDYSAAKGGVIAFTKALAMEVGKYSINVNCVSPGAVETRIKMPGSTFMGADGRGGTAQQVADAIVFLASDKADFITGQNYIVDGGRTLGPKA